jgi:hypothetical protein
MDADGEPARAGIEVVAGEGAWRRGSSLRSESSASGCAGITTPLRSAASACEGQSCQRNAINDLK